MGVTGLWTVVQPCARPIKLETLNKRRLAVDASIWIYQFLKAVRDKEGNALRNSHIVGFFRRICKLLYFGIKPVFVFDGGAPILKRQTIASRKSRREGRREDAVRTAGKLLAVQLQRTAEEEAARHKTETSRRQEEDVPDVPVYAEEILMSENERRQARQFKKKDAYHLPELQGSLEEMGAPNDPRIMSRDELEEYARQFYRGEDINLYDFSKIDFDSAFFVSLPATDRYNILNAARLRSRLRMGYSKEQLDIMFPDRMAFSKFQIERVKERNDLTQRLMNINGMNGADAMYGMDSGQRIAGERGKEYVLVKDNEVEGGWVLGVVGNKEGAHADKPIDVDRYGQQEVVFADDNETSDDDEGFEDVPVEGLNRLPKLPFLQKGVFDESIGHMQEASDGRAGIAAEDDSLFVQDEGLQSRQRHDIDNFFEDNGESEDEDLRKAIEMSLESGPKDQDHEMPEVPINRDNALPAPPKEREPSFMSESDDEMDFATALAQSKKPEKDPSKDATRVLPNNPFDGPLPFESIKLNKKSDTEQPREKKIDDNAGGFEKEPTEPSKEQLLPPWFSGKHFNAEFVADRVDDSAVEAHHERQMTPDHQFLKNHKPPEVIDVDELSDSNEVVDLEAPSVKDKDTEVVETIPSINKAKDTNDNVPETLDLSQPEKAEASTVSAKDITADEETYEWEATDDEKPPENVQTQFSRAEPSPSPEFEDVTIQPEEKTPDISVARPEVQVAPVVDQAENLLEEEGYLSDPEDEDLMRQLAAEGEEHARFAATLNSASGGQTALDYEQELKQLRSQQKKDRRDADEVSQVMITECQQLLSLFGLPYITAPMEAEAQCAELVSLGLVDGIITDDSDIFLFGGTRVYKNMFNQGKFVECYLTSDLEKEYALHRRKLISFAHLLGSDYTEGIPGVGPVTALEILTEFSNLEEFRDWWTQVQMGVNDPDNAHAAFHKKFKKNASKIFLPPAFPNNHVDTAYLEPEVDSDPSAFQWGVPDLHGLRNFLMATIGWSQERTDEVLVPVIRDMNRRDQEGTQSNITTFFNGPQGAGAFAPRVRSGGKSRMEKAFSRLRQEAGTNQDLPEEGEDGVAPADEPSENNDKRTRGQGKGKGRGTKRTTTRDSPGTGNDATTKKRKTRQGTSK
ncbi:DNA repair protein rad2 [Aspergillus wentii]|nr:DNA repair protein rad2 [Aspergillus wentii]